MVAHTSTTKTEQHEFDFLVIFSKPMLRVDEVCSVVRKNKDTVYSLCDSGDLEWHQAPGVERAHRTITRRSLIGYLAKTARYQPDDFVDVVFGLFKQLAPHQRAALLKKLNAL